MGHYPVVCTRCGATAPSGIYISGASNCRIEGNLTNSLCSRCGGAMTIPDGGTDNQGRFYFANQVYNVISSISGSRSDFSSFNDLLKKAKKEKISPEIFYKSVEKTAPLFSPIIPLIKSQNNRMEFYTVLMIILTVLVLIESYFPKLQGDFSENVTSDLFKAYYENIVSVDQSNNSRNRKIENFSEKTPRINTANVIFHKLDFNKKSVDDKGIVLSQVYFSIRIHDQVYDNLHLDIQHTVENGRLKNKIIIGDDEDIFHLISSEKLKFVVRTLYKSEVNSFSRSNGSITELSNLFLMNRMFEIRLIEDKIEQPVF